MTKMPNWWLKQRAEAKAKKAARRQSREAVWWTTPYREPEPEGPMELYTPDPNPRSWYQFCTDRKAAYESRGDHVAAMVWWTLRYLDKGPIDSKDDPCTEDGYADLCGYWEYKIEWLEQALAEN